MSDNSYFNDETFGNVWRLSTRHKLNILYGRRGVGKTTFLIQFSIFLSTLNKQVHFISLKKERDKKIEKRLIKTLKHNPKYLKSLRFDNIQQIIFYLGEKLLNTKSKEEVIILDDILPVRFLVGKIWTPKLVQQIGILLPVIVDLLNSGYLIWISVPEYEKYKLPRRWQLFIEFTNVFYRLAKRQRIRLLSLIKINNIPPIGSRWETASLNIRIIEEPIGNLLLTHKGFITLKTQESE